MQKIGVFIGRFQPFHNEHERIILENIDDYDNFCIVIGSSLKARDSKNPFTFEERVSMIKGSLTESQIQKTFFIKSVDHPDDTLWETNIISNVNRTAFFLEKFDITLLCPKKDDSSYYLDMFSCWHKKEIEISDNAINATDIRKSYFLGISLPLYKNKIPKHTLNFLDNFKTSNNYITLQNDYKILKDIKESWKNSPYPPVFVTSDTLVKYHNKYLFIKRAYDAYGANQIAIPGGYLEQGLSLAENAQKELLEETNLKVPLDEFYFSDTFDNPSRSLRGRIITQVFFVDITSLNIDITQCNAGDDAGEIVWLTENDIADNQENFFEDHYFITERFV